MPDAVAENGQRMLRKNVSFYTVESIDLHFGDIGHTRNCALANEPDGRSALGVLSSLAKDPAGVHLRSLAVVLLTEKNRRGLVEWQV
jgi:hypothetical protein